MLKEILNGGAKVCEAGAMLAGGHSVQDDEPKYGLVVFEKSNPTKCGRWALALRETFSFLQSP